MRQSSRWSSTSTAITSVTWATNPCDFSTVRDLSGLSTMMRRTPKSAVSARDERPDVDLLVGKGPGDLGQPALRVLQENGYLLHAHRETSVVSWARARTRS